MIRHDLIESGRRLAAILCPVAGTTPTNVFARDPPAQRGRRPHFGMSPDLELKIDDLLQKTALPSLEFALQNNVDAAVMTNRLPRIYRSRPCPDTLQTPPRSIGKIKPLCTYPHALASPHTAFPPATPASDGRAPAAASPAAATHAARHTGGTRKPVTTQTSANG